MSKCGVEFGQKNPARTPASGRFIPSGKFQPPDIFHPSDGNVPIILAPLTHQNLGARALYSYDGKTVRKPYRATSSHLQRLHPERELREHAIIVSPDVTVNLYGKCDISSLEVNLVYGCLRRLL